MLIIYFILHKFQGDTQNSRIQGGNINSRLFNDFNESWEPWVCSVFHYIYRQAGYVWSSLNGALCIRLYTQEIKMQ